MIDDIIEYIKENDLRVKSRHRYVLYKRYYLYSILRKKGLSLSRIAKMFNQSHATIIHGLINHDVWHKAKDPIYFLHTRELREMFLEPEKYKPLRIKILECDSMEELDKIKEHINNNYY